MQIIQTRRRFLAGLSATGAAGILGARGSLADEGSLETTTIRLAFTTAACIAPMNVAEAFLRAEGFENIQYVRSAGGFSATQMVGRGEVDLNASFTGSVVYNLDAGLPITALAGLHVGCYELFATEPIRSIGDLKGRRVGIQTLSASGHLYVSIMAKHVGLDPMADIEWVVPPSGNSMEQFAAGETDAFLGFPPEPQELRARGVSRVIVNTTTDKPWSQYFCCMIHGNRAGCVIIPLRPSAFFAQRSKLPSSAGPSLRPPQTSRRSRVHGPLRLRVGQHPGDSIRPLARVHRGGHDALLRASSARGGHDQEEPECAPRRRHRLALRQRAEARAEGITPATS